MANDFLRQKREQEFQARVLAALEKPKQNRFLKIINAPLFLWFLSASLLTIGGAYFTGYQQCVRDTAQTREMFLRLNTEIEIRKREILSAFERTSSLAELRAALREIPFVYADLKARGLYDLNRQMMQVYQRIAFDDNFTKARLLLGSGYKFTPRDFVRYGATPHGEISAAFEESEYPAIKAFAVQLLRREIDGATLERMTFVTANCSIPNVVRSFFDPTTKTLNGRLMNGLYESIKQSREPAEN